MKKLSHKEEEVLYWFWEKGPLFIKELRELYDDPKPHYNTLSTVVRVLEEKGYIGYKPFGNTYQYYALVDREEYSKKSLRNLVGKYFENSYSRVVSTLIEEEELSIDELENLIRQIKNNKNR